MTKKEIIIDSIKRNLKNGMKKAEVIEAVLNDVPGTLTDSAEYSARQKVNQIMQTLTFGMKITEENIFVQSFDKRIFWITENISEILKEAFIETIDKEDVRTDIASSAGNFTLLSKGIFSTNFRDFISWRDILNKYNDGVIGIELENVENQKSNQKKLKQYHKPLRDLGLTNRNVNVVSWTILGKEILDLVNSATDREEISKGLTKLIVSNDKYEKSVIDLIISIRSVFPEMGVEGLYDRLVDTTPDLKRALSTKGDLLDIPNEWVLMMLIGSKDFRGVLSNVDHDFIASHIKTNYPELLMKLKTSETRSFKTVLDSILVAAIHLDVSHKTRTSVSEANVVRSGTKLTYVRDENVKFDTKENANYICAGCGEQGFEKLSGGRYIESHHMIPLGILPIAERQKLDTIENTIALCATCHKKTHLGKHEESDSIFETMFGKIPVPLREEYKILSVEELRKNY